MQPTETLLIKFTLDGSQIEGAVQVPAGSVPKKAILPVLRQLTDSVVSIATQTVEQGGDRIACHKGCDACCRQMVPLAPTEIFGLAEVLERMSAPLANRILQKFDEAIDAL